MQQIPPRDAMQRWTLLAMHALGGSGHNREIEAQVRSMLNLPPDVADQVGRRWKTTVLDHRIAWARTHLKFDNLLDNPKRSIWTLTEDGARRAHELSVGIHELTRQVRDESAAYLAEPAVIGVDEAEDSGLPDGEEWRQALLERIVSLSPGAFERLCQRLLRESGFVAVTVTGRPSDGGIDGHGMLQMAKLITFPVLFQCKRWQSAVGPDTVRDFRGAMLGRADRGIIITTSAFTTAARQEATRDGAPPIDLIDGNALVDNLYELNLGVKQVIVVDDDWFNQLQSWADDAPAAGAVFNAG